MSGPDVGLRALRACFEGGVPAVIATASADGIPNVTYLSRVRLVDDERVALSNQFFSKTTRNLVENPRADLLVIDPRTYEQHRLHLVYERTDRRGPVFDQLRCDVDLTAALQGMQDVFRLRAADIYRVVSIEHVDADVHRRGEPVPEVTTRHDGLEATRIAELSTRLARCGDLGSIVDVALDGLADLFGFEHAVLLLFDEAEQRLFTIAAHGYDEGGVGAELTLGDGLVGVVAEQCAPVRVGNARQAAKYARTVRRSFQQDRPGTGRDIELPGLSDAKSQLAVPAMALGSLVGVVLVESEEPVDFVEADEAVLTVVASVVASAIEAERAREREVATGPVPITRAAVGDAESAVSVRSYVADGSVFVDGEYVIKGVAGRILTSLLRQHLAEGRTDFTSREVRLDPSLELPGFRDNFDSRLLLLIRRLDDREFPIRVVKTGRGRFRLDLSSPVALEVVAEDGG